MTHAILNAYYLLEKTIKDRKEEIARLEAALVRSPAFDVNGVPKNPTPQNCVEKAYIEILQRKDELRENINLLEHNKRLVEQYIDKIPDLFTQRIFEKRVYDKMSFRQIAKELGGGNTEEGVRQAFNRYLKKNP